MENVTLRTKGKHSGRKRPPTPGGERIRLDKKQGRNLLKPGNGNPGDFLVFTCQFFFILTHNHGGPSPQGGLISENEYKFPNELNNETRTL